MAFLTCLDLQDPFGTGRRRAPRVDIAPPRTAPRASDTVTVIVAKRTNAA